MYSVVVNDVKIQLDSSIKLENLIKKVKNLSNMPLAAIIDNEIKELDFIVEKPCNIRFLDITSIDGFRIYQRSVVFVMILAAREILGKDVRVVVEHSLNKNYYCEIVKDNIILNNEILTQIELKMMDICQKDIPIEKFKFKVSEGIEIAKTMNLMDKVELLQYRVSSYVNFYKLDWLYDYFYGPMVISTGCLSNFALALQGEGFMLNFPNPVDPLELRELINLTKISQVFLESNSWAKILQIDTVGALNAKISQGRAGDIIRVNEALHEKKIAAIADEINNKSKKIVLVAGPSSSGKTTFAQRLRVQLEVHGFKVHTIGLDNYYVNRTETPLDKDGKPDFESLHAIDIAQFNKDLGNMLLGQKVDMPKYNFLSGKREYKGQILHLNKDDIVIIEGIHGLNPKLIENIDKNSIFRVFISALTQLNLDDHNRIPAADTRMVRRMVRDNYFRGFGVRTTINMWPQVTRGEVENIFPYQEEADFIFNSALVYEMCILKLFAIPLLFEIGKNEEEYIEARRLLKLLDCFMGIVEREVPNNSILREFIGGSCFMTH